MRQTAQEKVLEALTACGEGQAGGVTASDLSTRLQLSRNVVSHYLNRLCEQGLAQKREGKPVRWTSTWAPDRGEEGAFSRFIGWDGSCREAVELCKAAVDYPPDGLPVILCGPSGVGKSALAELICQYARASEAVGAQAPLVTLNCADYASNPELLSSTLFGYKKGAFTGADQDREGLVRQADGGYLFLDEVHRLSFENQEKLFILLDQGRYRPLGESGKWLCAKVRLVCATTEDVDTVLVQTFRRRIPVRVDLPCYSRRPLEERLQLVRCLCAQEAGTIGRKIRLEPTAVDCLLRLDPGGNVGALRNIIRLSCARALHQRRTGESLVVSLGDLRVGSTPLCGSPGMLFAEALEADSGEPLGQSGRRSGFSGGWEHCLAFWRELGEGESWRLRELANRFSKLDARLSRVQTDDPCGRYLERLISHVCAHYGMADPALPQSLCTWHRLCQEMPGRAPVCLGGFLAFFRRNRPHAAYVAGRIVEALTSCLPRDTPRPDWLLAAAGFLVESYVREDYELRGLVAAHGDSTATSIAAVANQLCHSFVFESIDMPMDTSVDAVARQVRRYLEKTGAAQGLVLLVDMGSLSHLYTSLKNDLRGNLLIINNVTTAIALDVGTKIVARVPFQEIARYAERGYQVQSQYYEGLSLEKNIVFSCISGLGIAEKLREIVMEHLDGGRLQVIPMEYGALKQIIRDKEYSKLQNTQLIVTTTELPDYGGAPVLVFSQLWEVEGEQLLWECLCDSMSPESFAQMKRELFRFFSVEGVGSRLRFLNPKVVTDEVEEVLAQYEKRLSLQLESFRRLNLFLHLSVMIERLLVGDRSCEENWAGEMAITPELAAFIALSRQVFAGIVEKYHIVISGAELALLHELLYGSSGRC